VDDIKQRFLFSLLPQANEIGMEFEGIHPVDIGKITHDANDIVLVRELWSRDDNRVYILVDGVDYPVRTFVPQKTTSQWYPFYVFVNNRIPNDVIGVSDIELQKEMQTRINRKLSDDEKFRWLSLPRFVYDKTSISNCELKELLNTNPGELIGVELLNRESNLGNLIMPLQYQYSPYAVDVSRDEQYLRRFSYIPQQVQGEQGRANFAAEVDAGIGGMDLMTSFKMSKMENFLERVYNGCGELMILNNSIENVKKIVGSRAVWSIVLGDKESDVLSSQVKQEAM
jgi:hypothetical protein